MENKRNFTTTTEVETYDLYNGEVKLKFDARSHIYTANNEQAYGVTSIIKSGIDKSGPLMYWAVNMGVSMFLKRVRPGVALDELEIEDIAEAIKTAHRTSSNRAKSIGTLVHETIEAIVNARINKRPLPGMPTNESAKHAVQAFLDWEKRHKVEYIFSERKIYSKKYGYAGTVDIVAKVDGKLTVLDIKTSKAIYDEMFFQTAAYSKALEEELGYKILRNIILRVDKDGKGVEPKEATSTIDECFKVFLHCQGIYEYQMKTKNGQTQLSLI